MSLAALLMMEALGVSLADGLAALAAFEPLEGRGAEAEVALPGGAFILIDESYNANPASAAAALRTLGLRPAPGRRIAVLTDMLELGATRPPTTPASRPRSRPPGRPGVLRRAIDEIPLRGASADSPRRLRGRGGGVAAAAHPGRRAWGCGDGQGVEGVKSQGACRRPGRGPAVRLGGGRPDALPAL